MSGTRVTSTLRCARTGSRAWGLVALLGQRLLPGLRGQDARRAGTDPPDRVLDVDVPQHHGVVITRRGHRAAVGAEHDGSDGAAVAAERLTGLCRAGRGIPQP